MFSIEAFWNRCFRRKRGEKKIMTVRRLVPLIVIALLMTAVMASAEEIPAGTKISVRVGSELNSGKATVGQEWQGSLARDLVINGKTVASKGSTVRGKVTAAKSSGRLHAPGELSVRLTSVETRHGAVPVKTSSIFRKGDSHTKSNATKIGGGTAAGAVLGGIFGGGKGALIGASAGAAAGTGVAAATGKKEAVIPAESMLIFTTTAATTNAARKH
jgi:hypothetical protein